MEGHTGVQVSVDSQVEIVFTATFASMIRDGLYQILDGDLLARLGSSPARALYRSLAAHRIKHDHLAQEFTVNLRDWINALGLSPRADMALRTLNAAHERLTDEGYLHLVEDVGRGDKRQLVYRFLVDAQPEQVAALIQRGVVPAVAASLSAAHPDRIMPAIRRVEARVGTGWKPRSLPASIVDAVKDPEKWEYAEVPAQRPKTARKRSAATVKVFSPPEPVYTPQETVLSLLRVKLNREVTPKLTQQVHDLTPAGVDALRTALIMNSKEDAGRLAASILGESTLSG
ncbi:hypothetical protein ACFFLM_23045 [Deinococcus oregonensis]|uniref:Uncharacterized protein n=1 Tax=Deinococcus oregonensis TaxID=1805970 RepID=A0ABV6B505_9DEIO